MTPVEGQIEIDVSAGGRVGISSSRPFEACRIMIGKAPQEVLTLLPLLFSVCGVAQARAARLAIQRELGIEERDRDETARDMLVLVECAREGLLRIFLDWPRLFELETDVCDLSLVGRINHAFAAALFRQGQAFALDSELAIEFAQLQREIDRLENFLRQRVFEQAPDAWLEFETVADIEAWAARCDSIAASSVRRILARNWGALARTRCPPLPGLETEALLRRFDHAQAGEFIAFPEWRGSCRETTALTRQRHRPLIRNLESAFGRALITRWMARLVELAAMPGRLRGLLGQLREQTGAENRPACAATGLAQVEAARGRLIHRVKLADGVVGDYRILAPTEWNFHPDGLVREALEHLDQCAADEREQLARVVINAIDPCVGFELRIH